MKFLHCLTLTVLAITLLSSCANFGDRKFNPEFTPEFKAAYTKVSPLILDIGTVLAYKSPSKATKLVDYLIDVRGDAVDLTTQYPLPVAVEDIKRQLLDKCGITCMLSTTRPYVVEASNYIDKLKDLDTGQLYTIPELIDQLVDSLQFPATIVPPAGVTTSE